ncbi:hypothetical protein TruAng_000875 [Truncatella angustata]|nr:hypothetical protein TruAng_000875 [Truncatella angustata]
MPSTRRARKSVGTGQSPARKRMDKENITVDVASSLAGNGGRKKSRSKSMGPGGFDALKPGSGNRRVSLAAPARPPPRSILKPTMPILPEIPPHKPKSRFGSSIQGRENSASPFGRDDSSSSGTKIALRTEEEQQSAARKRDEEERKALEKEVKDRREARRKSLANRRVSFAAEATLHTFQVMEFMQDSTTSTDDRRRASSLAAPPHAPTPASPDASEPPSTPPEQEDLVADTPEHQRDLHQKKRRRSSVASTSNFHDRVDDTLASSVYSSDSEATDGVIEEHEEINSDSASDSDNDGTTMDLDIDEVTGTSIASGRSNWTDRSDDSVNDTLDDALRTAQMQAQTQSIDEEEEIIPSFGWAKKPAPPPRNVPQVHLGQSSTDQASAPAGDQEDEHGTEMDMDMDMEMTHAMGGIIKSNAPEDDMLDEEEMSMDVTKVIGGIISQQVANTRQASISPSRVIESSPMQDATMDMTMALGGIRQAHPPQDDLIELESNIDYEDMSMELTTVMGGVLGSKPASSAGRTSIPSRRRTVAGDDEATMDMTIGLGRILPANKVVSIEDDEDSEDNQDEATMGMEMTTAIGGIIAEPYAAESRALAKHVMEEEANQNDSTPVAANSPAKRRLSALAIANPTPNAESPGFSPFRGNQVRRSTNQRHASSSPVRNLSPAKSSSPFKELTPKSKAPSSSLKTPPARGSAYGSSSPVRPTNISTTPKSVRKSPQKTCLFQQDPSTGVSTPRHVLTPQNRRLSGIGADRSGLGSPKVAQILDRRGSIGETASDFVPENPGRGVTFADPRIIEIEAERERVEDEDRENGRKILEREADGDDENLTATLKGMISSMTPKKKSAPFRGRKSLAVGSARGLLGKRPAELDDEDEGDERDGIKRLKGHQSSPVKNVRLNAPPSKAETTGRTTRASGLMLGETSGNAGTPTASRSSPLKTTLALSPQGKGKFKDVEDQPTNTFSLEEPSHVTEIDIRDDDGERMHLQDFLNMTSIRFMELTTTKRRHTQAPDAMRNSILQSEDDISLERCVVAGACTVPMLELYQHSCRELKKYISEGRRIVREIETETLEENPPLFKEYISASPEFKLLMDNQFKNVKTHARLLSKAMWYEWRTQLQDGLKEGLAKIVEGMDDDERVLQKEEELLHSILPGLLSKFEALQAEHETLQAMAEELADCDPEDLQAARAELMEVDSNMESKMRQIEALQKSLKETEAAADQVAKRKQECVATIEEAEQVREECRGWSSNEINSLKARVDAIEKEHGWNISGITGSMVSMTYRREIELVFDIASFQGSSNSTETGNASNSRIDLWYIAANRDRDPQPATPEKEFFVQAIRDYVRSLNQASTKISTLLRAVGSAWTKAGAVANDIHLLNCTFPSTVTKTGDSSIAVRTALLLVSLETKLELTLGLQAKHTFQGVQVAIIPEAKIIYGEHFKVDNVREYLSTRMGDSIVSKADNPEREPWSDIVVELHDRLMARGRK